MHWRNFVALLFAAILGGAQVGLGGVEAGEDGVDVDLLAPTNLVAWCIVPFDAKRRGPEERAEMLERLGLRRVAYDWREEHIPTFDEEVQALRRHGIELKAWWFPADLGEVSRGILDVLKRYSVRCQLWVTLGDPAPGSTDDLEKVRAAVRVLEPIAKAAGEIGCELGLYNHGGWFGEPEHQVEVIRAMGLSNVGIVYNFHHGHEHSGRFKEMFGVMQPYLLAVNLNGMVEDGEAKGRKILQIGEGDLEEEMIRVVIESGWAGPVGVLDHRPETDSEETLRGNLEGLESTRTRLMQGGAPYRVVPAARTDELTPALREYEAGDFKGWNRSHGDDACSRYSSLGQIHRGNVKQLGVAWTYRSGDGEGNIQCNPIVVKGLLVTPTPGDCVVAVDGSTGEERWRFKPDLRGESAGLADDPARRGLVYWPGEVGHTGRLLFGAGRWVFAIDAEDGRPIQEFGENGRVRLPTAATVSGAVYRHVFVIPGFERDVFGYDVRTGELIWRFHTIPQAGEFGADTWLGPEQGANCWGGMAMDADRGLAYVTTGSPKPDFLGMGHVGRNLFANCIVALDALTGERRWHFQEVRHDIWDWDIPSPPVLATVEREGRRVDVVAAVSKLGNTLVLDRMTGKPLFPFRLRKAPASLIADESTWPYQPDLEVPAPLVRQVFDLEDVTQRTEVATEWVMKVVGRANLGWFQPFEAGRPTVIFNEHGGAEWTGAALDPQKGRLYVNLNEIPWYITVFRDDEKPYDAHEPLTQGGDLFQKNCAVCHGVDRRGMNHAPPLVGVRHRKKYEEVLVQMEHGKGGMPSFAHLTGGEKQALADFLFLRDRPDAVLAGGEAGRWTFGGWVKLLDDEGYPGCTPPWGALACLDLNSGKLVWKVPLGEYPELTELGMPLTGTENFGGASVTAGGLVFVSGTRDKRIRAFDAENGEELWSHDLPWHGTAPPTVYEIGGVEYVVVPATGGGKLGGETGDAWVAFALGGVKGLPVLP
ncbi:MAG: hypothetical protein RI897_588 [Verrucomicrobiota bacterium]|jgi:quinoprotein glucose dehydrogenase